MLQLPCTLRISSLALAALGAFVVPAEAQRTARARLYNLIVLPGDARVSRVSALGAVAGSAGLTAFVWRQSTGLAPLAPLTGWDWSAALDVNRSGLVVGRSTTGSVSLATVWDTAGVPTSILVPGATSSFATAINNAGVVVGNSDLSQYGSGWVWDAVHGARSLSTLGLDPSCTAADVNESGQIVGGEPYGHAWRFDLASSTLTDLGTLGSGYYSEALGVNDRGHVVGMSMIYASDYTYTPFLWTPETGMKSLGTLAPAWTFLFAGAAWAVNDDDVVVGSMAVKTNHSHAFVWDHAYGMRDLNELVHGLGPYELEVAYDISNSGWIVGRAWDTSAGNAQVSFVLVPR
jgi:probable HAF family extracellular repeat protein